MSLDEFLKGLSVFKKGMQEIAQTEAMNEANQAMMALRAQKLNEADKLAQINQVSQTLASRLMGTGGLSPEQAADAAGLFAPSQGAQFQAEATLEAQKQGNIFKAGESRLEREHQRAMQDDKLEKMGYKDEAKLYGKIGSEFKNSPGVSDLVKNSDKLSSLKSVLDKTPDQVGVEMAKVGLLKFAGEDRVSDADVARAQRDPSLRAGIARRLNLELRGNALKDDREFYQAILGHAEGLMKSKLDSRIQGFAQSREELLGVSADKVTSALRKEYGVSPQPAAQPQAATPKDKVAKLEAWLATNAAKDPAKAEQVKAAIKKLKALSQ